MSALRKYSWSKFVLFYIAICCSLSGVSSYRSHQGRSSGVPDEVVIPMPTPSRSGPALNEYRCTAASLPTEESYIIEYEPRADARMVHHMLLFGCNGRARQGSWDCKSRGICEGYDEEHIMYAWALNASGTNLPKGVGYKVGQRSGITSLVLQIHYGHVEEISDMSSVSKEALALKLTRQRQQYIAGIFLLGAGSYIPAGKKEVYIDAACRFRGPKTIHPFAFRTHAHSLGKQIVGYVVKSGKWQMIGTRSPQDPQAFYPVHDHVSVDVSDVLAARCVYNTENKHSGTSMGPDSEDEMCNFYIMYFTKNDGRTLYQEDCWSHPPKTLHFPTKLPPLPSHLTTGDQEEVEHHHHHHDHTHQSTHSSMPSHVTPTHFSQPVTSSIPSHPPSPVSSRKLFPAEDWSLNGMDIPDAAMGQVSAVAVDTKGGVHVLHRGPVTWDMNSFRDDYIYNHILDGPIKTHTLIHFSSSGKPLRSWGTSLFYMPHGLTIDHHGSFWVTDVALHQVFKFHQLGDKEPSMVLGKAFHPGEAYNTFCQPSSVAVERSGQFYVSDGYCNSRIMKFSATGKLLHVWDDPVAGSSLFIPHKAILNAAETILYVADRENRRIVSYNVRRFSTPGRVFRRNMAGTPYAISLNTSSSSLSTSSPDLSWQMFGVFGGRRDHGRPLMGFTLDSYGRKIGKWGPKQGFANPHDLAVDTIHSAVYITEIGPNRIWKFVPEPTEHSNPANDLDNELTSSPSAATPIPTDPLQTATSFVLPAFTQKSQPEGEERPATAHPTSAIYDDDNSSNSRESDLEDFLDSLVNVSDASRQEAHHKDHHHDATPPPQQQQQQSNVNVGVVVTVVAVTMLALIITVGVIKEYRHLKFKGWRFVHSGERDTTIGVKPSGSTVRREKKNKPSKKKKKIKPMTPYNKLQSVLGASKLGFSRLKTYDSDSEEEEFPVFNRV